MRSVWMGNNLSNCQNSDIWGLFWMNRLQMLLSVIGMWRVGGKLQVLSSPWLMLRICSFSVQRCCMSHCSCLFCCMAMRQ